MTAPRFATYREALDWIYSHTNTERTGHFVRDRDREDNMARERALLAALGNPQNAYKIVHVAGTKGKGSTSAMIAAILQAAGYRTGLYTSPDLHTFRERIRMNGEVMPEAELVRLAPVVGDALEPLDPTLGPYIMWEVATALGFLYFSEARADAAVIEVGLGGRLDATNVVAPLVSVITSISYDHMNVLGNTLAEIAGEKAGIIKSGVPVVTSAQAPDAVEVIARIAAERRAPLIRVGPDGADGCDYTYRPGAATSERQTFDLRTPRGEYRDVELALLGEHQIENAAAAIAVAEHVTERGLPVAESAIRQGLCDVEWQGRLQVVHREPWVVVDAAHNADSFAHLFAALRRHFSFDRLLLVLGVMADKDIPGIAREIARAGVDSVIVTTFDNTRVAAPQLVTSRLAEAGVAQQHVAEPSADAIAAALEEATPRDLICVAGSVAFAGEALRRLAARPEFATAGIAIAGVDH